MLNADEEIEEALDLYWNTPNSIPKDLISRMIGILRDLYMFFSEQKRYNESEKEMKAVLKIYQLLDKKEPSVYTEYLGMTYLLLALSQYDGKKYNEAKQSCEESITIFKSLTKQNSKIMNGYLQKAQDLLDDICANLEARQ